MGSFYCEGCIGVVICGAHVPNGVRCKKFHELLGRKTGGESLLCPECNSDDTDDCTGIANMWCKRCGFTWNKFS